MLEKRKKHDTSDKNNPDDVIHDVHLAKYRPRAQKHVMVVDWLNWEERNNNNNNNKTSPLALPVGHKHLFYPRFPTLGKTSFISVQERLLIDNYALPNLYISLSLFLTPFLSHLFSPCAFLP